MAACWEGAGGSEDDVRGPLSRLPKVDLGLILTHSVRLPKGAEKHEREAGSKREQRGKKKKKKGCGCPLNLGACLLSESTATLPKINSPSSVLTGKHTHAWTHERWWI